MVSKTVILCNINQFKGQREDMKARWWPLDIFPRAAAYIKERVCKRRVVHISCDNSSCTDTVKLQKCFSLHFGQTRLFSSRPTDGDSRRLVQVQVAIGQTWNNWAWLAAVSLTLGQVHAIVYSFGTIGFTPDPLLVLASSNNRCVSWRRPISSDVARHSGSHARQFARCVQVVFGRIYELTLWPRSKHLRARGQAASQGDIKIQRSERRAPLHSEPVEKRALGDVPIIAAAQRGANTEKKSKNRSFGFWRSSLD